MSSEQKEPNKPATAPFLVLIGTGVLVLLLAFFFRGEGENVDPYREQNTGQLVGEIIQVSVKNGCGVSGLAGELTQYLRKHGFDVVEVGDYTSFNQEYSFIYDRIGDLESARKLAEAVGLPEDRVIQEIDEEEYLDATIVIGKDYSTLTPFTTNPVNQ